MTSSDLRHIAAWMDAHGVEIIDAPSNYSWLGLSCLVSGADFARLAPGDTPIQVTSDGRFLARAAEVDGLRVEHYAPAPPSPAASSGAGAEGGAP